MFSDDAYDYPAWDYPQDWIEDALLQDYRNALVRRLLLMFDLVGWLVFMNDTVDVGTVDVGTEVF